MTARRSQAGYTLMELLLVIGITGIIFVPLMAWAGVAIRQQPEVRDGLMRTAETGFLGSYFPKDVAVAGKAAIAGNGFEEPWASQDCVGGAGAGGSRVLALATGGEEIAKIVYAEAPSAEDPGVRSLWRRSCLPSGQATTATEVFTGIRPGSTSVACTSAPGDARCRQIQLRVTPAGQTPGASTDVVLSATRRLDEAAVPTDEYGTPLPTAAIDVVSRNGNELTLSGDRSSVVDGTIVSYRWEFEPAAGVTITSGTATSSQLTAQFAGPSSYTVILTVTDDRGNTSLTMAPVSTTNQLPVAVVSVDPASAPKGSSYTLSADGSYDPDGAITNFEWLLTYPSADGVMPGREEWHNGTNVTVTPPADFVGVVSVRLAVTDAERGEGTSSSSFTAIDPADPGPGSTTIPGGPTDPGTTIPGGPTDPGQLVAVFADADAGGASRSFDATGTTGTGTSTTYTWNFGDGTTGTGATVTHAYPNPGQYTVRLDVVSDGRSAASARVVAVGGAAPAPQSVWFNQGYLYWTPVPGARRYLVDFEYMTSTDCYRQITGQAVGATTPYKEAPPNPCPASAGGRARVGTDANGSVTWSAWIPITVGGPVVAPVVPPTETPVVK